MQSMLKFKVKVRPPLLLQILLVTYALQNALLETQGTLNKNPDCLAGQRVSSVPPRDSPLIILSSF